MADLRFFRINRTTKPDLKAHALSGTVKAHALSGTVMETRAGPRAISACGVLHATGVGTGRTMQVEDRIQPAWEYCGRCSRIVTARADTGPA